MYPDSQSSEIVDDEINLWELLEHLKNGWQWLVGGCVVGLVGAFGFVFVTPAQYEATVVIQPASIGMRVDTLGIVPTALTTTVEPVVQTLERMKPVTFYNEDTVKACQAASAKELANSVKANLVKGNSLLSISYRATSVALANTCMDKIVESLTQSQSAIAAPLIKELEEQRASTKQQIEDAEEFLKLGEKQAAPLKELSMLMILKRDDLMKLQKLYREQRIQLTEPLTQPMKLFAPIYVSENPVYPKKSIVLAGGLLGGLFVGLLALFVNRSWRRYRGLGTLR